MKSNHKHIYQKYIQQAERGKNRYNLAQRCVICGYQRDLAFKHLLIKRPNGTVKLLLTKEDFLTEYGDLPVVDLL